MRISDWSSDVCSSDLPAPPRPPRPAWLLARPIPLRDPCPRIVSGPERLESGWWDGDDARPDSYVIETSQGQRAWAFAPVGEHGRSDEHTSEIQSLMRTSYDVFSLNKKRKLHPENET